MNLLTLGAVSLGLYLLTQRNKKLDIDFGPPKEHNLPKFFLYDKGEDMLIDYKNEKLILKTNINIDDVMNNMIRYLYYPVAGGIELTQYHGFYFRNKEYQIYFVNLRFFQEFLRAVVLNGAEFEKCINWLYSKNYKLINDLYYRYLKNLIMFIPEGLSSENHQKNMEILIPKIVANYLDMLKLFNIPENKWPGQDLKGLY